MISEHHLDRDLRELFVIDRRRSVSREKIYVRESISTRELFRLDDLRRFVLEKIG
jgi:hypothetical protein